jgi:hypothetical protein
MIESNYKSGLTWRSVLGLLYAAIVIEPAVIWVYLATGNLILSAAVYASILVFSELSALSGKSLTKQEILVFLLGSSAIGIGVSFGPGLIYSLYFRRHSLVELYGITNLIPDWVSPSVTSPVWDMRTFLNADWLLPIGLSLILIPLSIFVNLSLGFLTHELYVENENLPFPLQQVGAQLCSTLAERNRSKLRIFMLSTVIAMFYGVFLYMIPQISAAVLNASLQIIPLPWIDLNNYVEFVFPGGSFGIATDLVVIAMGLILPIKVIASVFIGSFAVYFVGNGILAQMGLFTDWSPGMSLQNAWQRSILHFWAGPNIALAIAAGVLPLVFHPKLLVDAFRGLLKIPVTMKRGSLSLKIILTLFFAGSLCYTIIAAILVPDFPLWIFLFLNVGWVFIINLIVARAIGVTGISFNIPYVREGLILVSGYPATKYDAWFAPVLGGSGGADWCANFKTADLTNTWPMDLVKGTIFALVVGLVFGFIYTQMFWTITPIPSSLFPVPFWDINVTMTTLFLTRQLFILNPIWIGSTFIIGLVLQVLMDFAHLPISVIGIAAGTASPIANSAGMFLGLVIGEFLGRYFGKKWIEENKATIFAGILSGEGLIVAFGAAIAMIFKAIWIKPF